MAHFFIGDDPPYHMWIGPVSSLPNPPTSTLPPNRFIIVFNKGRFGKLVSAHTHTTFVNNIHIYIHTESESRTATTGLNPKVFIPAYFICSQRPIFRKFELDVIIVTTSSSLPIRTFSKTFNHQYFVYIHFLPHNNQARNLSNFETAFTEHLIIVQLQLKKHTIILFNIYIYLITVATSFGVSAPYSGGLGHKFIP